MLITTHVVLLFCLVDIVLSDFISGGIAFGASVGISTLLAGYSYFKCQVYECCDSPWLARNYTGLHKSLSTRLYGQHLVIDAVTKAIKGHFDNEHPKKALVMSFHGWTGNGKNYVSNMIVENMYSQGMRSKFVHLFAASLHFPHEHLTDTYTDDLRRWIMGNISQCEKSIFIFDEVDKLALGVIDSLKPFIDYYEQLRDVDFRKSVFLLLSNTGGDAIVTETFRHWKTGAPREEITLNQLEKVLRLAAFNDQGGLSKTTLIRNHLIDIYVPFLPLERKHVVGCIKDTFQSFNTTATKAEIDTIADELSYDPPDYKLYSTSGCKRIAQKVMFQLQLRYSVDKFSEEKDEL